MSTQHPVSSEFIIPVFDFVGQFSNHQCKCLHGISITLTEPDFLELGSKKQQTNEQTKQRTNEQTNQRMIAVEPAKTPDNKTSVIWTGTNIIFPLF